MDQGDKGGKDFSKSQKNPYVEKIKKGEVKIESAPTERATKYATVIGDILDFLHADGAYVTDETVLSDLLTEDSQLRDLMEALGVKVSDDEPLVDVAERYVFRFEKER